MSTSALQDAGARPALSSSGAAAWFAVAATYAIVTIAMATPFVDLQTLDTATFVGDGRLVVWNVAWVSRAIINGLPLFDANIYFPARDSLAYGEHMTTLGVLAVPIRLVTPNPVLAFSVLWLASFWANAMAAHALAFRLTKRHDAALMAGLTFGWSYFRVLHLAHLQLQWTAWLPLGMLLLERWYRSPSPARLLWAAIASLAQILTSWYLAVLSVLLNTFWLAWLATWHRQRPYLPRVLQLAAGAGLGALLVLPFMGPYLRVLRPGPLAELQGASADVAAYLVPPADTIVGGLVERFTSVQGRWVWGEQTLFLGWIALALALFGATASMRSAADSDRSTSGARVFFLLLGVLGFLLSLGPLGHLAAPFDLLMRIPGMTLFRAPARFALLVLVAVSMLAAFGGARVYGLIERRRGPTAARALSGLLGIAMLVEWYPVGPNVPRAEVSPLPAVYRVLERLPAGAVMSLPDYRLHSEWFRRADYLLFASFHWRLIVNGYGRSEPPEYQSIVEQLSTFPSASAAELARALRVRYFVVHSDSVEAATTLRQAAEGSSFRLVTQIGADGLFEVAPGHRGSNALDPIAPETGVRLDEIGVSALGRVQQDSRAPAAGRPPGGGTR